MRLAGKRVMRYIPIGQRSHPGLRHVAVTLVSTLCSCRKDVLYVLLPIQMLPREINSNSGNWYCDTGEY